MTSWSGGYPTTVSAPRRSGILSRTSPIWRLDWVLMIAVLGLSALGAVLVYSATRFKLADQGLDPMAGLKRHLLNLLIGLVLGLAVTFFDHRMLRAYAPLVYVASVIGLVAVLSPLGSTVQGQHSWILLPGGFSVQPSEFAKVALCVGLAMILAERKDVESEPSASVVLMALGVAAVPVVLIMLQPDLGTTIVILCLILGMLVVGAVPARWIILLLLAGGLVVGGAVHEGVLKQYQVDRFRSFIDPNVDPQGSGYQLRQAGIAIGSGGVTGRGLFEGTQTKGNFIPEQDTDFIFTVAGEELGFLGGATIILLLGLLLWRAQRIAMRAEDMFGRLMAVGVLCWFGFQAFENIGMTLRIMPMTGVPLPFVSYGGSAMFANFMAIGLLQNVHLKRYT